MSGTINSGMDVVVVFSADMIERVVRARLRTAMRRCFELTYPLAGVGNVPLRKVIPLIESVRLTQQPNLDGANHVYLNVSLFLLYGEAWDGSNWTSLKTLEDQLNLNLREQSFSLEIEHEMAHFSTVNLTISSAAIPDWVPQDLRDQLDITIPLSLDFLTQMWPPVDDGAGQMTLLEAIIEDTVQKKVLPDGNLAVGLNLRLTQDEIPGDDDEDSDAPGGTIGHCGLPEHPGMHDLDREEHWAENLALFHEQFSEDILDGQDWAIALDAFIVDAMLRGIPSANLNQPGNPSDDCEQDEAMRFFCLSLEELQDGVMQLRGMGQFYHCPDNPAPDGFWVICFTAEATLEVEVELRRVLTHAGLWEQERRHRLQGSWTLHHDVEVCGSDSGWTFWVDVISFFDFYGDIDLYEKVPEHLRSGTFQPPIPNSFGSGDDPTGRLRLRGVQVRPDGLVVRGAADVRARAEPRITAPERVLFGSSCNDEVNIQTFYITAGDARLQLCPPAIREVPENDSDGEFSNPGVFSVVGPEELLEEGDGLSLRPGRSLSIALDLDEAPGDRFAAILDLPNNATETSIKLFADKRPTTLSEDLPDEIRLERTDYLRACYQGYPYPHPIRESFELIHFGPGPLHICAIEFEHIQEGRPVLDENGEPSFHWTPLDENPTHADGTPLFVAGFYDVTEPGTRSASVVFAPGETYAGIPFLADARLVTNAENDAGDFVIPVFAWLQRGSYRFQGIFGRFDLDTFCGHIDWDMVQDSDGIILVSELLKEVLNVLGGDPCCPPPHGVDCQCVDLLEVEFLELPADVDLEILDDSGDLVAGNQSRLRDQTLAIPINNGEGYALKVRINEAVNPGYSSRINMRRWILQQDGVYNTIQALRGIAVQGEHCYASGPSGLEVIDLSDLDQPICTAYLAGFASEATDLRAFGELLLIAENGLRVYRLANPHEPTFVSELASSFPVEAFLTSYNTKRPSGLVWAWGEGLVGFDLADPKKPRLTSQASSRVRPSCGYVRGDHTFLFGKGGMEIFDISQTAVSPVAVAFMPTDREVRNAFIIGSSALLAYDDRIIDRVDISDPANLQVTGSLMLEKRLRKSVLDAGSPVPYQKHFLILKDDRLGFRTMRLRRNHVDQKLVRDLVTDY